MGSENMVPLLKQGFNWVAKKHDFLCLSHSVGVHQTVYCEAARLSEVRCAEKPKIACYSIVPDQ